jgi:integrase
MSVQTAPEPRRRKSRAGQIIPRGRDIWLIRWVDPKQTSASGRRRVCSETVHGSKKNAEAKLAEKQVAIATKTYVPRSRITVVEFFDRWLEHGAGGTSRTQDSYRWVLEKYARPELGALPLQDLEPMHVRGLLMEMAAQGYAPRTIRLTLTVVKQALAAAVEWKHLPVSPAALVKGPKRTQREMRALDAAEIAQLRKALQDLVSEARAREADARALGKIGEPEARRHALDAASWAQASALIDVLLTLGLRPGEALAARWSDVDLERGLLSVVRALTWVVEIDADGKRRRVVAFGEPKAKSKRTLPIGPALVAVLKGHKAAQAQRAIKLGSAYDRAADLVFATPIGTPIDESHIGRRWLKPALAKAELDPSLRVYDLRHTAASQLLGLGLNVKVVSERLGHASAKMTLDVYSHVLPGMQEEATAKIEAMLLGS